MPARRYASAYTSYGPVSVCVCPSQVGVLVQGWPGRGGFWHAGCFRPIVQFVLTKFRYLQNKGTFPLGLFPRLRTLKISSRRIHCRNMLPIPTWLEKGGRSEHDKLDCRRSTKLTIPPSSDAALLYFITGDRQALSTA